MNHPGAILEVAGIKKQFPGVLALNDVGLHLMPGEVLSLIGENGAGKSTLMKILAGVQQPDAGTIWIQGEPVEIQSCRHATSLGISLIHQELNLSDNLSIGANIFLGREPVRMGVIDRARIKSEAYEVLKKVGLDVDPDMLVRRLSIGKQQLVEIAKALSAKARVLIMDEPTSSLSTSESERLFEVVDELRRDGVSVIYISHRLGEVKQLSDRVEVLRDGENAGHLAREEISHDAMVRLMVGRDVSQYYNRSIHPIGEVVLQVKDLATSAWPTKRLNFEVKKGEIVGVAGLVGAGRTEMLEVLFGVMPALEGTILIEGETLTLNAPLDAINAGMALVPEGRKEQGLIIDMNVRENVSLAGLWRNRIGKGRLNKEQEQKDALNMIDKLGIKTASQEQIVRFLFRWKSTKSGSRQMANHDSQHPSTR